MLAAPTNGCRRCVFQLFTIQSFEPTRTDLNTVLDGTFKAQGVENRRVVDITSWPNVPGWFIMTPTYMVRYNSLCSEPCLNLPQVSEKQQKLLLLPHTEGEETWWCRIETY
ncbi:hypothetical protein B0H14DRAFT_2376401 [Mycena olivaceomarginata]|nr:hypothetical protein B0H14DRAFT_2376401 [Mycena olivaceomarginata]